MYVPTCTAVCAHSQERNFRIAFEAAEDAGIPSLLVSVSVSVLVC